MVTAIRPAPGDVCLRRASDFAVNPELKRRPQRRPPSRRPSRRHIEAFQPVSWPAFGFAQPAFERSPRPPIPVIPERANKVSLRLPFASPGRSRPGPPFCEGQPKHPVGSMRPQTPKPRRLRPDRNGPIIAYIVCLPKLFKCMA